MRMVTFQFGSAFPVSPGKYTPTVDTVLVGASISSKSGGHSVAISNDPAVTYNNFNGPTADNQTDQLLLFMSNSPGNALVTSQLGIAFPIPQGQTIYVQPNDTDQNMVVQLIFEDTVS